MICERKPRGEQGQFDEGGSEAKRDDELGCLDFGLGTESR